VILKKWSLTIGFCLTVLAILAAIKFSQIKAAIEFAESFPETMETVEFASAVAAKWTPETSVIAETVAIQSIELRNELGGVIESVYFKSGEHVKKGQLLLSLETSREKAQLTALRADVKLAEAEYKRAASVVAKGAASESIRDQREAERDSLIADEQELLTIISKKNIRAPFEAQTGLHELEVGQYLTPGTFLTNLVGVNSSIWVDFSLPQQKATLKTGDPVEFSANGFYEGKKPAVIIARSVVADSQSRNVRFRAELDNPGGLLFPGIALMAHIATNAPVDGVTVPAAAIRYDVNGPYVFILDKIQDTQRGTHRAIKRPVNIQNEKTEQVFINGGLTTGEEIATFGSFKLREGILVNAVSAKPTELTKQADSNSIAVLEE